ncbi:MBL fold metallo-hydrolase [Halobacillus locisalis]|uniref:MBL fold metallo-hydrolase n=1 Tax=Halobacillus locisalis TaxID=220753 RepID=A0A838CP51_9BACI|nr:MBL fold metallo-hydrolase [Halobacillus locisalis]MBA2173744.1 MBL fold metallo-hydrolase [Halobacillus locisalis]
MIQYRTEQLTVFQSLLYQTTSAVLKTDGAIVIVDPNWLPNEVLQIKEHVQLVRTNEPLYVIYTHSDFDHVIGSGVFPDATVIATEDLANHPDKEGIEREVAEFDQGYYLDRSYTPVFPEVDIKIDADGQILELGGLTLYFYKAPGHTKDSLFTIVQPLGLFLSGDYLSDVEFPFISSSYQDYVATISKAEKIFQQHSIKMHVPGHGSMTKDVVEMLERLSFSKYYLEELATNPESLRKVCQAKYRFYNGIKEMHEENIRKASDEQ